MSFQFAIEGAGVVASVPGFVYESTACGICRRWQGDEVAWLNPLSRWAHEKCVKQIESVESKLTETTNELFKGELNNRKRQIAHLRAIEAVSARCAPDSIADFLEENGREKTAELFNTVGIEAAKKYAKAVAAKL